MNGEPQRKKSTSPWLWVGCGCLGLIAAGIAFVAFIVFVVFASIRASEPYKEGVARARGDARVQEALGTPVEPGWLLSGNISTQNRGGSCALSIPLNGSNKSGTLSIVGTKEDGRWTYTKMLVTPVSGPPIDLLAPGRT